MQEAWMRYALELAEQAGRLNEIPIGAVVVKDGEIIGRGFNRPITASDPSAHAEIEALRDAALALGNYRLSGTSMVVTVEPCTMCAGALIHARIERLIFGAREPRAGAICSAAQVLDNPNLNHRVEVVEGVLANECSKLMSDFFQKRRH
jgi:tRNA(adenine34) deaminase